MDQLALAKQPARPIIATLSNLLNCVPGPNAGWVISKFKGGTSVTSASIYWYVHELGRGRSRDLGAARGVFARDRAYVRPDRCEPLWRRGFWQLRQEGAGFARSRRRWIRPGLVFRRLLAVSARSEEGCGRHANRVCRDGQSEGRPRSH